MKEVFPSSSVYRCGTPSARRSSGGIGGWIRFGTSAIVSWPHMANSMKKSAIRRTMSATWWGLGCLSVRNSSKLFTYSSTMS